MASRARRVAKAIAAAVGVSPVNRVRIDRLIELDKRICARWGEALRVMQRLLDECERARA